MRSRWCFHWQRQPPPGDSPLYLAVAGRRVPGGHGSDRLVGSRRRMRAGNGKRRPAAEGPTERAGRVGASWLTQRTAEKSEGRRVGTWRGGGGGEDG